MIRSSELYKRYMNKTMLKGTVIVVAILIVGFLLVFTSSANLTQEDAIRAVISAHPDLAVYRTTSLPPSSIEAKQVESVWYVGFIQSGSGVQGILNARCYRVNDSREIYERGQYTSTGGHLPESIDLETCAPVFAQGTPPPATEVPPTTAAGCYIGGCSQQLCTDQPDAISTCEYTAAYVCYNRTYAKTPVIPNLISCAFCSYQDTPVFNRPNSNFTKATKHAKMCVS